MSAEQRVEDYLIANGPATASELTQALAISQSNIQRILANLTTGGQVRAYSFDQKLYSANRKPTTLKALLRIQLCALQRMHAAYDSQLAKHGLEETDRLLIEALRAEMIRWSTVINAHEDNRSRNEV